MALFKSGQELFDIGQSCLKQGNFSKAISNFQKASQKLKDQGNLKNAQVSDALVSVLMISLYPTNPSIYYTANNVLSNLGEREINFGVRSVKCSDIASECVLKAVELEKKSISTGESATLMNRGEELKNIGIRYQKEIGNTVLFLPELFNRKKITGLQLAYLLFAEGLENLAEGIVLSDPKKAAEYYQNASNYRKQAGDIYSSEFDKGKVDQYKQSACCWFCGREIIGKDIHFLSMPSVITEFQLKSKGKSPLPSVDNKGDYIYACKGCYEAISLKANEIANYYHELAMNRISEVRTELQYEIDRLERMIG